jgi:hypothetical protein
VRQGSIMLAKTSNREWNSCLARRPTVEAIGDGAEVMRPADREVGALGQILAQRAVDFLRSGAAMELSLAEKPASAEAAVAHPSAQAAPDGGAFNQHADGRGIVRILDEVAIANGRASRGLPLRAAARGC